MLLHARLVSRPATLTALDCFGMVVFTAWVVAIVNAKEDIGARELEL